MGIDALNPIQLNATDMGDTKKLKAEFGDKLTFWELFILVVYFQPALLKT